MKLNMRNTLDVNAVEGVNLTKLCQIAPDRWNQAPPTLRCSRLLSDASIPAIPHWPFFSGGTFMYTITCSRLLIRKPRRQIMTVSGAPLLLKDSDKANEQRSTDYEMVKEAREIAISISVDG
jgi:hypothetical protein